MKTIFSLLIFTLAAQAASMNVDKTKSWLKIDCKATGHSWTAKLKDFSPTIAGDPVTLMPSACDFTWKFSDIDSAEADRDIKMLTWLDSTSHPSGSFKMTGSWKNDAGQPSVKGQLTIHGVSVEIAFPVTATKDGKVMKIDGEVWIDTQNFSLPIVKMLIMTVNPKVRIYFHMEGTY
jgi:polyisoprenoid-binding protein YceI